MKNLLDSIGLGGYYLLVRPTAQILDLVGNKLLDAAEWLDPIDDAPPGTFQLSRDGMMLTSREIYGDGQSCCLHSGLIPLHLHPHGIHAVCRDCAAQGIVRTGEG